MLTLVKNEEFDIIYKIMKNSFPIDERRTCAEQFNLLDKDNYRMYAYRSCDSNCICGFIATWEFDDLIFIEHLAVSSEYRNNGIGSSMLKEFINNTDKMICLEVEPPKDNISRSRIEFYKRAGFYFNNYDYCQPPISKGKKSIALYIMTYNIPITYALFKDIQDLLYKSVYGQ